MKNYVLLIVCVLLLALPAGLAMADNGPHGTPASMGAYSGAVQWPDGTTTPNGNNRSSLLRVDNRGVCELCHVK